MPYANNKGADQPAHPRSLISAFVVRCPHSIIHILDMSKISSLYLASLAAQAGLRLTWSQTPKTGFLVTWLILYLYIGKCCATSTIYSWIMTNLYLYTGKSPETLK